MPELFSHNAQLFSHNVKIVFAIRQDCFHRTPKLFSQGLPLYFYSCLMLYTSNPIGSNNSSYFSIAFNDGSTTNVDSSLLHQYLSFFMRGVPQFFLSQKTRVVSITNHVSRSQIIPQESYCKSQITFCRMAKLFLQNSRIVFTEWPNCFCRMPQLFLQNEPIVFTEHPNCFYRATRKPCTRTTQI